MEEKPKNEELAKKNEGQGEKAEHLAEKPEQLAEKPERKDMRKGIFAGASCLVLLVIVISVLVTMQMQKNNSGQTSGDDTTIVADEVGENTGLSAAGVEAIIDGKTVEYAGAYVVDGIEATISSGTYESTSDDEAVFLVINGGSLKIDGDVTINKSGSENFQGRGDDYSFYGTNSAIVVVGEGSSASINGASITTTVSGANAVVATNGGEVLIENSTISTSKDNSRGLHATYQGSINADGVTISTLGGSCAALATDRGEGTVVADNMTLSTAGAGSPLIYSTGSITVTNSKGTATGAQIAVVEGKNSISLNGCDFSANGNGNRGSVDNAGVMIYQSMSGDASVGMGSFTATDCTLTVLSDSSVYSSTPFFFVTNTNATIDLTGTEIAFSSSANFISAIGTNEWGRSGLNGADVTITMSDVEATNTEVEIDSISSVSGL